MPFAGPSSSSKPEQCVEIVYGCNTCRHSKGGCKLCCPAKASEHEARKEQELLQLNPGIWPVLAPSEKWTVRYWDSLEQPLAASQGMAAGVLNLLQPLGVPEALPEEEPSEKQKDGWSCGVFVLAVRKYLGELNLAQAVQLKEKVGRVAAFLKRLAAVTK